jgi:hypothetical protein
MPKWCAFLFGSFLICIGAIIEFVCILSQWLASALFVIWFCSVLAEIDQAFAW